MRYAISGLVLFGILLAGNGRAADRETEAIRLTILKTYENWSALQPDANDPYYAAQADAVWYDVTAMQYFGWAEYKAGVKETFKDFQNINFVFDRDITVNRAGKIAWATATWKAEARMKDGKEILLQGRFTKVLQKQKGKWVIVHEHVSVPASL